MPGGAGQRSGSALGTQGAPTDSQAGQDPGRSHQGLREGVISFYGLTAESSRRRQVNHVLGGLGGLTLPAP